VNYFAFSEKIGLRNNSLGVSGISNIDRASLTLIKNEINTLDTPDLRDSGIPYLIPESTRQKIGFTIYCA